MKKLVSTISLLLTAVFLLPAFGQRDAPIAQHAATLTTLLKKDYNALAPEMRDDEILRDQSLAISLFKLYLPAPLSEQDMALYNTELAEVAKLEKDLAEWTRKLDTYTEINVDVGNVDGPIKEIVKKKPELFKKRIGMNNLVFEAIESKFDDKGNVFVKQVAADFRKKYGNLIKLKYDAFAAVGTSAGIQKSIPFIGGDLAFETAIDGLSRFLAKRIKQELTVYTITQIKSLLEGKETSITYFKTLMPKTTAYLEKLGPSQGAQYFPNEIRQFIAHDLSHILDQKEALEAGPLKGLIESQPQLKIALEGLEIIPMLSKAKYPIDVLKALGNQSYLQAWKKEDVQTKKSQVANSINMVVLLANSLTIIEGGEPRFAGMDFFNTYFDDDVFYKLFIGFLRVQNDRDNYQIKYKTGDLASALAEITGKDIDRAQMNSITHSLRHVGEEAELVYTKALEIRRSKKAGGGVGADTVYTFVNALISTMEHLAQASDVFAGLNGSDGNGLMYSVLTDYFVTARKSNEVFYEIQQKNYALALNQLLEWCCEIRANEGACQEASLKLTKLISLINDLTLSEDEEDVEKAIEAFAMPQGSYAVKRAAKRDFSINAYPGLLIGLDRSPQAANKNGFAVGFTAPIGLSFSGSDTGYSHGVFLSLIDIGALTRLRLDSANNTTLLPEFSFKNIFAPGVYYSLGIKNTPFGLNIGVQYGPELKEIRPDGQSEFYESFRVGLGLVLDVPLFNISSKPK